MRIFISAGDPSGDRHSADVVHALKRANPDVQIDGFGGRHMRQAGVNLIHPLAEEAIIGITAAIPRLRFYRRLMHDTVAGMKKNRTDVLVLVDYPGFNLRFAQAAKAAGIKTVYYIGPQIWAWGAGRITKIKRAIDLMLVVFDFEMALYERAGVPVRFVGHPLLEQMDFNADSGAFRRTQGFDADTPLLGLFPGSRKSELDRVFPVMLQAGAQIRKALGPIQLAVAAAPGLKREQFERWMDHTDTPATILEGLTHPLMQAADLALVTSGTATLETALLGTPQIILYRTDPLTYWIARYLVTVPHIGLVNVVAQKELAPELIQHRCNPKALADAALRVLKAPGSKAAFAQEAHDLRGKLGKPGAADRAALAILELAQL